VISYDSYCIPERFRKHEYLSMSEIFTLITELNIMILENKKEKKLLGYNLEHCPSWLPVTSLGPDHQFCGAGVLSEH